MSGAIETARYELIRAGKEFLLSVGLTAKDVNDLQPAELLGLCVAWSETVGKCVLCGASPVFVLMGPALCFRHRFTFGQPGSDTLGEPPKKKESKPS